MLRVWLLVVWCALVTSLDDQCKDPLFETHWFGKYDIMTLNSIPTVKTDLKLCPQFNDLASCCSGRFELEQQRYFDDYRNIIFESKLARIRKHQESVNEVRTTPMYKTAGHTKQEQYYHALQAFNDVLAPEVHGECFSALLTFTAGMTCFACRPDWFNYVTMPKQTNKKIGSYVVERVHVHPSVCMEVWSHCQVFGEATMNLKQALLDSVLAKQAKRQAENMDSFGNQQALCNYLHNEVALHPFQRPSMAQREAAPGKHKEPTGLEGPAVANGGAAPGVPVTSSTLPQLAAKVFPTQMPYAQAATMPPTAARRLIESPKHELDIMKEGKLSGFNTVWPGTPSLAFEASHALWLLTIAAHIVVTAATD